jgi:predicted permease
MILRSLRAGLKGLFRREAVHREMDEELAHYLDEATRENLRAGMTPADAARAARARIGSALGAREEALSGGWESGVDSLVQDLHYSLRAARRNPGFTATAILTLALGIGATTAMFSVVNAVLLRPLPWRDAGRLAFLWTSDARRGLHQEPTAVSTIGDWRSAARTLQDIAYYSSERVALAPRDASSERGRSRSAFVSGNLFGLLGVAPARGRPLGPADHADRAPVMVISHGLWQRWFDAAPDVIGRTITVDDRSRAGPAALTVVGVMPPGFYFPDPVTEIWTPATRYWRYETERDERFPSWARRWTAVGRLADGASLGAARDELSRIGRRLEALHPSTVPDFPGFGTTVTPVLDAIAGRPLQRALWVLLGAVGLVLLVTCVNVANLLLARGAARQSELAVRQALGAGRGRVVRQLVAESLLLALAGGALGTLAAGWGTRVLGAAATGFVPRIGDITVDGRVLGFALGVSIASGLVFGLMPALRLSRPDVADALRGAGHATGRRSLRRSRDLLVMAECTLALVLLVGAGLLLRSLGRLQAVDPGFDPGNVLIARLEFAGDAPPRAEELARGAPLGPGRARAGAALADQLLTRIAALPGVLGAGFSDDLFVAGQGNEAITIPGRAAEEVSAGELNEGALSPGAFAVLRVPLRRGRLLADDDVQQKIRALWTPVVHGVPLEEQERRAVPEPVVVNEAFVRRFFPHDDPVARRFCIDPTGKTYWYEIVGVVGDMRRGGLERAAIPEYFGPWYPLSNARADLLVRTAGDPLALALGVRQAVRAVMPGATVVSVSTVDAGLGGFSALRRLQTGLLSVFAGLALALAAVGVFGLVHFTVAERAREIGVRMALGAGPGEVMGLVLRQGMRMPALGIAAGVAASLGLTRVLGSLLFGVSATDPFTFVAVGLTLGAVAAAACGLAGRRALRVDPLRVLRDV